MKLQGQISRLRAFCEVINIVLDRECRTAYERSHERRGSHRCREPVDELVAAHLPGGGVLADLGI